MLRNKKEKNNLEIVKFYSQKENVAKNPHITENNLNKYYHNQIHLLIQVWMVRILEYLNK